MGAFNTLSIGIKCSNCLKDFEGILQFKFGDVRQYHYKIGDKIKDSDHCFDHIDAIVYGTVEDKKCPHCNSINIEEFDIFIKYGLILSYSPIFDFRPYLNEYEGNYYIKNKLV